MRSKIMDNKLKDFELDLNVIGKEKKQNPAAYTTVTTVTPWSMAYCTTFQSGAPTCSPRKTSQCNRTKITKCVLNLPK